ncbi:unnamed protein product, partial [Gongylonema pulchrum]|uniref:RING-type domain-containing protein n=1 Tax=Gongylonema pulchrum TaxID=637853 RepID=A0A183F193_9BILA
MLANASTGGNNCTVCLSQLKYPTGGQYAYNRLFCFGCIESWMKPRSECPFCQGATNHIVKVDRSGLEAKEAHCPRAGGRGFNFSLFWWRIMSLSRVCCFFAVAREAAFIAHFKGVEGQKNLREERAECKRMETMVRYTALAVHSGSNGTFLGRMPKKKDAP